MRRGGTSAARGACIAALALAAGPAQGATGTVVPVRAGLSTVRELSAVAPTSVPADGKTAAAVTVTLKNAAGQPVSGVVVLVQCTKEVILPSDYGLPRTANSLILPNVAFQPSKGQATDAAGQVTYDVSSGVPGQTTCTAQTVLPTDPNVPEFSTEFQTTTDLPAQVTITFTPLTGRTNPSIDAQATTLTSTAASVPADGKTAAAVTVTLKNAAGQPVSGVVVLVQCTKEVILPSDYGLPRTANSLILPNVAFQPSKGQATDAAGQVTYDVSSGVPGQTTCTAQTVLPTDPNVPEFSTEFQTTTDLPAQVTITFTPLTGRTNPAIGAATIAVGLTAASGATPSGALMTVTQFDGAANSICRTATAAENAITAKGNAFWPAFLAIGERAYGGLAVLKPPARLKAAAAAILSETKTSLYGFKIVLTPAHIAGLTGAQLLLALTAEGRTLGVGSTAEVKRSWNSIGAGECADFFG